MFTKTFPSNHPECRITEFIRQANECDFFIKIPEAAYEYEIKNAFIILITNFAVWTQLTFFSFCPVNINFIKITLFVSLLLLFLFVFFITGGNVSFVFAAQLRSQSPKRMRNQIGSLFGEWKDVFFCFSVFVSVVIASL